MNNLENAVEKPLSNLDLIKFVKKLGIKNSEVFSQETIFQKESLKMNAG